MDIIERIREYLSEEGYRPKVDEDGDIQFKAQGLTLWCTGDKDDPQYFRIIMPNIYTVEGNRTKVLEAINTVCRDRKVVKAFLVENSLWIAVELFASEDSNVGEYFDRLVNVVLQTREIIAHEIFKED